MGRYLGGKTLPAAVRAITEAGMPKETMTAVEQAASDIKTEHKASVERAKNFGQESPVEHALRRAGRDPGEAAEIARRVEENQAEKVRQRRPGARSEQLKYETKDIPIKERSPEDVAKQVTRKADKPRGEAPKPEVTASSWTDAELHTKAFQTAMKESGGKWAPGLGERAQAIYEEWKRTGTGPKE
jgi:hypothetical protein